MIKSFADKAAAALFEGRIHRKIPPDIRRPALRNFGVVMNKRDIEPIHPGEVLLEDFMRPLGLSQYAVAKAISVSPRRINEIVHGKRAITADTALRLGRYFGTDAQSWLNLQSHYDLENAEIELSDRLDEEVSPRAAPRLSSRT